MKNFFIGLSAAYLIFISFLLTGLFILGFFLPHKTLESPVLAQMKAYSIFSGIVFSLWPLITGIGLFIRKNWARISILIMSALALLIGIFIFLMVFFVPQPAHAQNVKWGMFGFAFIFFTAIPIAFFVLFNKASVKEIFLKGKSLSQRPWGISLIAVFSLFSGVASLTFIFTPLRLPMGSILLEGIPSRIYFLVLSLASIYVGLGLLKLDKNAWRVAVGTQFFHVLWAMINILMANESILHLVNNQIGQAIYTSVDQYKLLATVGLVAPIITLFYLFFRKSFFEVQPSEN